MALVPGFLAGLLLLLPASVAAPALEEEPETVIAAFYDSLLGVMQKADSLGFEGRLEALRPAIEAAYDLPFMTRLVVGPRWADFGAENQARLVDAFRRFTLATYADRFDGYSGERFVVEGTHPLADGGEVVNTRLVKTSGDTVELDYLMRVREGDWRITDVYLTGTVSEMAVKRSEFASVLAKDGIAGLLDLLEQKIAELARS